MEFLKSVLWRLIKQVVSRLPRKVRQKIILEAVAVEHGSQPQDTIRWLLQIHDVVGLAIDQASIRWGSGMHIKHKLMDGIHSFFYERIPEDSKVLDLGCGIGAVADSIARHSNADVLGIDMSIDSISFARRRFQHSRLRFLVGNVFTDLPQMENFDVIVLSSVLEHLEGRPEFLKNLVQQFHPKTILIRVPTFEQHYFKALKRELGMFAYVDSTHVLEYSPEVFRSEMTEADLYIVSMEIRWGDIWAECIPNDARSDKKTGMERAS